MIETVAITEWGLTANLQAKLNDSRFRNDMDLLVPRYPDGYNVDSAAAMVIDLLLGRIDEAWRHA
ncbi:MAG: hypothetical protein FWE94_07725 [Coriobacteriia bacterium]|nr:hypothetical protein [Coriobacteriia bacterium]